MLQTALIAVAREAAVENRFARRRDFDNYEKARSMIDEMIQDKSSPRSEIKARERKQPAPDTHELRPREMPPTKKEGEGGIEASFVEKFAASLGAGVETLTSATKGKFKGTDKKG